VFSLTGRDFGATANICEHQRLDADPPCKRAVVSSILTGGSDHLALFALFAAFSTSN
jgi:hypothetical protein